MAKQDRNPNNSESPLFKALTKLFSGPIVNFREQARIRYRRGDMDRFAGYFNSTSGKAFKKSQHNPYDYINTQLLQNQNRNERYLDFDQMEFYPELNSALDIYADEMTTANDFRRVLHIESPNEEIREILKTLYYDVLGIEANLFSWCRTMCKYGDLFLYLDIDENVGVKSTTAIPSNEIERLEGEDKSNPNYVQYQWNAAGLTFENWQVAHFRILGQDKYAPYGTSVLEGARRIWRQLVLVEDAMMAYRIVRAPDRRVFYIDVGSIPPDQYEQHIQRIMTQMKRNQIVDNTTGRVDLRYNPMSIEEDYYIPVRGGQTGTKIETLQGGQFTSAIEDVKYLRDKLLSTIKIPQAYLARGEGAAEDKASLAQKDIRFARTIQRLQRVLISELEKIAIIHLYILGYRNSDLVTFKLSLNNPSKISELQELEHFKIQTDVAANAKEIGFSKHWIFQNIFKITDEKFLQIQNELYYDKAFETGIEKMAEEGGEEEGGEGGGGGGGLGGLGGGGALPELPQAPEGGGEGEEGAAPEGGEAPEGEQAPEGGAAGGEETNLLAQPAKRQFGKPKGKFYTPVQVDNREYAGRGKHFRRTAVPEATSGQTVRSMFPGYNPLKSVSRGIFNENLFNKDEKLLTEIGDVLNNLSKKFGGSDES